jgi:hypothetical protein
MYRKLLLTLIFIASTISLYSASNHQSIKGHGNNQVHGDNNRVNNNARIKDASTTISSSKDYDTSGIMKDLDEKNYKEIVFKEKKKERSSRKKVLILTATNFEIGVIHEAAQKAGLEIQKELVHDYIVYRMGTLGGVDIVHMQPR